MLNWMICLSLNCVTSLIVHFVVSLTVLEPVVANKYTMWIFSPTVSNTIYNALKSGVSWLTEFGVTFSAHFLVLYPRQPWSLKQRVHSSHVSCINKQNKVDKNRLRSGNCEANALMSDWGFFLSSNSFTFISIDKKYNLLYIQCL